METFLGYLALGMLAVSFVWGVVLAFQKSIGWGLISLFLAPAGVIAYLIMTIKTNYKPLALMAGSIVLLIIAFSMGF